MPWPDACPQRCGPGGARRAVLLRSASGAAAPAQHGPRLPRAPRSRQLRVVLLDLAVDVHGAELRPAHRAELGGLEVLVGEGLVVHAPGRLRVERETELLVAVERIAGAGEGVVAVARCGTMPRAVR